MMLSPTTSLGPLIRTTCRVSFDRLCWQDKREAGGEDGSRRMALAWGEVRLTISTGITTKPFFLHGLIPGNLVTTGALDTPKE